MLRAWLLLACVLLAIWWLWTVPIDDMRSLLATIGALVLVCLAVAGVLSLAGQIHLWWIRRGIRRLR